MKRTPAAFRTRSLTLCLSPCMNVNVPVLYSTLLYSTSAFQAKKIVENALLSKLQEAQRQVEEKEAALARSEEKAACLATEKARQEAAVSALTRQLQDANRYIAKETKLFRA